MSTIMQTTQSSDSIIALVILVITLFALTFAGSFVAFFVVKKKEKKKGEKKGEKIGRFGFDPMGLSLRGVPCGLMGAKVMFDRFPRSDIDIILKKLNHLLNNKDKNINDIVLEKVNRILDHEDKNSKSFCEMLDLLQTVKNKMKLFEAAAIHYDEKKLDEIVSSMMYKIVSPTNENEKKSDKTNDIENEKKSDKTDKKK